MVNHLNTGCQICPVFECFRFSNVRYSDPYCTVRMRIPHGQHLFGFQMLRKIIVAAVRHGKEHSCRVIGRGQGLREILCVWSGCIGGWCAVLASWIHTLLALPTNAHTPCTQDFFKTEVWPATNRKNKMVSFRHSEWGSSITSKSSKQTGQISK